MRKALSSFFAIFLLLGLLWPQDLHSRIYAQDEELILVGVGAFQDGLYEIAEKQFLEFLKSYPKHPRTYEISYLLGKTFLLEGKAEEGRPFFIKILNECKNFAYMEYVLYWLAEAELQLGNTLEARNLLFTITKRFPKFEWVDYAYYLLGLLDVQLGKTSQAEAALKKVSMSSKSRRLLQGALFWLGLLSFRHKEYEKAVEYLRTLLDDPEYLPRGHLRYTSFWLGEAQLRLGRWADAKRNFGEFLASLKTHPMLPEIEWRVAFCDYRIGNFKESVEVLQRLKNHLRESLLPYTHYLLGKIFFLNRDLPAATREINSFVHKSPTQGTLAGMSFLTLYWLYIHLDDVDGASKVFQRLQKFSGADDEKDFIQWLNAEWLFAQGKISDSLPYYFNILNSRFREKALYRIGRIYFLENKLAEAITNLDILLLEFPNSQFAQEALFVKAECLNSLGRLDAALETYQLVLKRDQKDLWGLLALMQTGNVYMARNELHKAQRAFKVIIDQFATHPLYYHAACQLGKLNFKINNFTEAVHYFSLVLKGNILELFGEAHFGLGEIFYHQGKYDKALNSFEAALRYLGETSLWYFITQLEIANLYRKWGQYEEAKRAYSLILDHSKDEEIRRAAKLLLNELKTP